MIASHLNPQNAPGKTLINPKKPQEPNFNDVNANEDRPIGGEMDKLIAERLARIIFELMSRKTG